ncbi:MAG: hypothetical protein O2967_02035 [Proteobacteria bacterium]|nr:hypothetical protein [Pseudomonadota bacterium]
MTVKKSDRKSHRQLIRHLITAKLAVGAACLVLSATVAQKASAIAAPEEAKISIADRIEAIRSSLRTQGAKEGGPLHALKQVAQWYNWPNWRNGWNDWRNQRWFNYRR